MNVKLLSDMAHVPTKGTPGSAGFDLYACIEENGGEVLIEPGSCVKIGTGIAIDVGFGKWGGIYPRSGISTKKGLRPANCVGVIDSDYRGEVIVAMYNDSYFPRIVSNGERIAQLIVSEYDPSCTIDVVDELGETIRGDGGFGSTGTSS